MKNLILNLFDEKAIPFMTDLKEKMLETSEKKNDLVEVHRFIWEYGEESLKVFIDQVNMFHPTTKFIEIKFIAEYSKEEVNFLHLNIKHFGAWVACPPPPKKKIVLIS